MIASSLCRHLDRFTCGLTASLAVEMARQAIGSFDAWPAHVAPPLRVPLAVVCVAAIGVIIFWRFILGSRRWTRKPWIRFPGTGAAAIWGSLFSFLLGFLFPGDPGGPLQHTPVAIVLFLTVLALLVMWIATASENQPAARGPAAPPLPEPTMRGDPRSALRVLRLRPERLREWILEEQPVFRHENDLVGVELAVDRVREALWSGQTVGLLGAEGSGKSTIVRLAHGGLEEHGHRLVHVEGWALRPDAAAAAVLDAGLRVLQRDLDVLPFRGLPASYRVAAQGLAPGWARWLLSVPDEDPLQQLLRLNDALRTADLTLNFDVQDIDRNGQPGEHRERHTALQALLDRLRDGRCDRMNFVVSASNATFAPGRLFERVIHVPGLSREAMAGLCNATKRMLLLDAINQEIHLPDHDRERVESQTQEGAAFPTPTLDQPRLNFPSLDDSLFQLLQTPRRLKSVLRETLHAWVRLRGEVDFDYLLAAEAVRATSPMAWEIIDRQRGPSTAMLYGNDGETAHAVEEARAEQIGGLAGPTSEERDALAALAHPLAGSQRPGGIDAEETSRSQTPRTSNRYLVRLRTGDPRSGGRTLDQEVLAALMSARSGNAQGLADLLDRDDNFRLAVKPFLNANGRLTLDQYRLRPRDLLDTAAGLNRRVLDRLGTKSSLERDAPSHFSLREAHAASGDLAAVWAGSCIELPRVLGRSLQLATDLLYCWVYGWQPQRLGCQKPLDTEIGRMQDHVYARFRTAFKSEVADDPHRLCTLVDPRSADYTFLIPLTVRRSALLDDHVASSSSWFWLAKVCDNGLAQGLLPVAHLMVGAATRGHQPAELAHRSAGFPSRLDPVPDRLAAWIPELAMRKRMLQRSIQLLRDKPGGPNVPSGWQKQAAAVLETCLA